MTRIYAVAAVVFVAGAAFEPASRADASADFDLRAAFDALCFEYFALHLNETGVNPYETRDGAELLAHCPPPLN